MKAGNIQRTSSQPRPIQKPDSAEPAAKAAAPEKAAAPARAARAEAKLSDDFTAGSGLRFKGGSAALDIARAKDAPTPDAAALARQKAADSLETGAFAGLLGAGKGQAPKTPAQAGPSAKTPAAGLAKADPQQKQVATQLGEELRRQAAELASSSPAQLEKVLNQIYGDKASPGQISQLVQQAAQGQLPLPANVRLVDPATLQGNNAAYSPENGGTVLLNRDLLKDPRALAAAFTEEAGHHLDKALGGKDSKGDEGQLFLQALQGGGRLTAEQLAAGRADRDAGAVRLDGRQVPVEFQSDSNVVNSLVSDLTRGVTDWAITDRNALHAHQTLIGLEQEQFNSVIQGLAGRSNGGEILNNYVKELAEADPSGQRLGEFLLKIAQDATPETARTLLQKIGGEAWGELLKAFHQLPEADPETWGQQDVVDKFGGDEKFVAKSLYEIFAASARNEVASADKIVEYVDDLVKFADKAVGLGTGLKAAIRALARGETEVIKAFAGTGAEAILHGVRHGGGGERFAGHLEQHYGIPREEGRDLANHLWEIYR
jgi:hypothetical protein